MWLIRFIICQLSCGIWLLGTFVWFEKYKMIYDELSNFLWKFGNESVNIKNVGKVIGERARPYHGNKWKLELSASEQSAQDTVRCNIFEILLY